MKAARHARVPLFVLFLMAFQAQAQISINGQNCELSVSEITDRTVRITLVPTGQAIINDPILSHRTWPDPALRTTTISGSRTVSLTDLNVLVSSSPLRFTITAKTGDTVQVVSFTSTGQFTFDISGTYPLFGLGQGDEQYFNRRGALTDMGDAGADDGFYYGFRVPVPFLIGTSGWSLFMHRPYRARLDLRNASSGSMTPLTGHPVPPIDLFISRFGAPPQVMEEFSAILGKTPMPPRWALGYFQSHRMLDRPGGPWSALAVADSLRKKRLPCDGLIYLGTGWCDPGWNLQQPSFTWNPTPFPDPQAAMDSLHAQHFKVSLHTVLGPGNLHGNIPPLSGESVNSSHISTYWGQHRTVFRLIDGWWPDAGETNNLDARLARVRMYYQGPLQDRPNVRPFHLHRSLIAGTHRYGASLWTGDVYSQWNVLSRHPGMGVNSVMSLTPFWGSDIGGFWPTQEYTAELYARWFQFGAFCPLFRSHGRDTWYYHTPWGWNATDPQTEAVARKYLNLRYQLMPYLYTAVRETYDTGLPVMRAIWFHYPADRNAFMVPDQYLWGKDILVAPVLQRAARSRQVVLPSGDRWYDFWDNRVHAGGQTISRTVDLETMPLYVRAGAVIPFDTVRLYTEQPVSAPCTIRVYRGADGAFTLYDDDNTSLDYLNNRNVTFTRFTWSESACSLAIEPDSRSTLTPDSVIYRVLFLPDGYADTVIYRGSRVVVHGGCSVNTIQVRTPVPVSGLTVIANPADGRAEISFTLDPVRAASGVQLSIVDTRGKTVRSLRLEGLQSGCNRVVVDGTDCRGTALAPAVYLVRLHAGSWSLSKKAVLIR
ncbi:MAG: DUF5110 domain-containing protein [Chitinispirillaceae bacterium]|nr:DUF5110 domain-containing protein [Chitinispirillaceae bacterium]